MSFTQLMEAYARGYFPVKLNITPGSLDNIEEAGLAQPVRAPDLQSIEGCKARLIIWR
jgi:hypothetical protein